MPGDRVIRSGKYQPRRSPIRGPSRGISPVRNQGRNFGPSHRGRIWYNRLRGRIALGGRKNYQGPNQRERGQNWQNTNRRPDQRQNQQSNRPVRDQPNQNRPDQRRNYRPRQREVRNGKKGLLKIGIKKLPKEVVHVPVPVPPEIVHVPVPQPQQIAVPFPVQLQAPPIVHQQIPHQFFGPIQQPLWQPPPPPFPNQFGE